MSYRRIRKDLLLTYRSLTGMVGMTLSWLFNPSRVSGLSGHYMKLGKPKSNRIRAQTRLSRLVIGRWNSLLENDVK